MPSISVIVPLYKTEQYVEKCLRSIMAQTFVDFEIICVDDVSPDASAAVVERLMLEDPRIRLIRHEANLGLGGARNTAIRAAQSPYIASVDSDDYITPDMLQAMWNGTEGGHFDVVVCGYSSVDPEGKEISRHYRNAFKMDPIPSDINPFKISNPAFWNKLWRTSLYTGNNIYFPNHTYYQDLATTPRIYSKAKRINFIGGDYYKYLVRGDSVTQSYSDKHLIDQFRVLDVLKEFFIKEGIYDQMQAFFSERIEESFHYHGRNVLAKSTTQSPRDEQYLRHLAMMRWAYSSMDDKFRHLDMKKTVDSMKTTRSNVVKFTPPELQKRKTRPSFEPRVLFLTLNSGENEYDECCNSIADQNYVSDHITFHGLGNIEAHERLYGYIMENSDQYDLFIKLDADMVIASDDILHSIVDHFISNPMLDHLIVPCDDWMTGRQIHGVHTFSNNVRWGQRSDSLFLDPSPIRPEGGKREIWKSTDRPYFLHSPNPSDFQAFHFGAHRALKIVQPGRSVEQKKVQAIREQWDTLYHVWEQYQSHKDNRHFLALLGAELAISGELTNSDDYSDPALHAAFEKHQNADGTFYLEFLMDRWGTKEARSKYREKAIGPVGRAALDADHRSKKKRA